MLRHKFAVPVLLLIILICGMVIALDQLGVWSNRSDPVPVQRPSNPPTPSAPDPAPDYSDLK